MRTKLWRTIINTNLNEYRQHGSFESNANNEKAGHSCPHNHLLQWLIFQPSSMPPDTSCLNHSLKDQKAFLTVRHCQKSQVYPSCQRIVNKNLSKSMKANQFHVSCWYKSYVIWGQFLTNESKANHVIWSNSSTLRSPTSFGSSKVRTLSKIKKWTDRITNGSAPDPLKSPLWSS